MAGHRVFKLAFSELYPNYTAKAERKGRSGDEVDEIIRWLTGYTQAQLEELTRPGNPTDLKRFFGEAPKLNEARSRITGVICGVRIEEIEDPLMREIRYLDKLIDELAKGRPLEKILRQPPS
ncbi:DUF2200 domain-containing protein [Leucobacter massiliensis]|uniref:DUF2200 domain-containing protein n=1 Tax=Leucobacter massiliensis TaxID=1686285 RepID=A0A2S9QLY7_9MICO|nr:DUF2200 domain-containing protein [Leucobacter massiliensis]PRI10602.1 hypothetical protein B4915_11475 [Leucobacter massiliensis]